jgi:hypothetical protein
VDKGLVQTVPAHEIRNDHDRNVQYFGVTFPTFYGGNVVEFVPLLTCAGRQCPPAHLADRFRSKFRLEPAEAPRVPPVRAARPTQQTHFDAGLTFVVSVGLQFEPLQFIGESAWGMRVNLVVQEGTVAGDGFAGRFLEASADNMLIRRDGMGVVRMRGAIAIDDGAIFDIEASGYVDFGPDAYRRAVAHDLPDRAPIVVSPLITTRHPKYGWLSRVQCIGTGQTHLDALQASYDVHAVMPRKLAAGR